MRTQSIEQVIGKTIQRSSKGRCSQNSSGLMLYVECKFRVCNVWSEGCFSVILILFFNCHRWHKELNIDYDTGKVDCSNVIMSNGRGHVLGKNRCGLCGRRGGLKARCCTEGCRGHGETRSPYFFHVTCARQAGYEVNHSEDPELLFYGTSSELVAPITSFFMFLTRCLPNQ